MKEQAAKKSQPIRLRQPQARQRLMFFTCSGTAIALVAAGWFFTMRDTIMNISTDVPAASELTVFREQFESATDAFRENTAASREQIDALLDPAILEYQSAVEQREAAANAVGEVFKNNMPEESALESVPGPAEAPSGETPEQPAP